MTIANYGIQEIKDIDNIFLKNKSGNFLMQILGDNTTLEGIEESKNLSEINKYIPFKGAFFGQVLLNKIHLSTLNMGAMEVGGKIFLYILGNPIGIDAPWLNPGCSWSLIKNNGIYTAAIQEDEVTNSFILRLYIPERVQFGELIFSDPFTFDSLNARIQGALIDASIY